MAHHLQLLQLAHHLQLLQADLLQDHRQVDHLLVRLPGSQEDLLEAHPLLCHVAKIFSWNLTHCQGDLASVMTVEIWANLI